MRMSNMTSNMLQQCPRTRQLPSCCAPYLPTNQPSLYSHLSTSISMSLARRVFSSMREPTPLLNRSHLSVSPRLDHLETHVVPGKLLAIHRHLNGEQGLRQ